MLTEKKKNWNRILIIETVRKEVQIRKCCDFFLGKDPFYKTAELTLLCSVFSKDHVHWSVKLYNKLKIYSFFNRILEQNWNENKNKNLKLEASCLFAVYK